MKKVYVASVQPDPEGPVFGRVIDPNDVQKLQDFSHAHITQIVKDLLVAGAAGAQVAGFGATATGGMNVTVDTGSVVDANGVSYDGPEDDTVLAIPAAHVSLPRIDLIYATLSIDTPAESEFKPFRQLRTQAQLEGGAGPYVPIQYDQPTELHTRATLAVRQGVAHAAPVAPAAGAGEVPLWTVAVAAGAVAIVGGNLTSSRVLMKSLYQAFAEIAALQAQIASGLGEIVQDIVGSFVTATTSIVPTYNDAGNAVSLALHTTYKSMLDDATDANTASKLAKRDASGHVRVSELKMDTGARFMPDNSFRRSAYQRETFYNLIDLHTPLAFHGAVENVYETLKRESRLSVPNSGTGTLSVAVAPDYDCYLDPADFQNVNFKLEVKALHTATQPPTNALSLGASDIQLWNATDSAQLSLVRFSWLEATGVLRSTSTFTLTGSGLKHLLVRVRHDAVLVPDTLLMIWRVRLIINPSF